MVYNWVFFNSIEDESTEETYLVVICARRSVMSVNKINLTRKKHLEALGN